MLYIPEIDDDKRRGCFVVVRGVSGGGGDGEGRFVFVNIGYIGTMGVVY